MVIRSFCGCMNLRSGSIFIATIKIGIPLIFLIYAVIIYSTARSVVENGDYTIYTGDGTVTATVTKDDRNYLARALSAYFAIVVIVIAAFVLLQVTLLLGISKENTCLILSWMITESIIAGFNGLELIGSIIVLTQGIDGGVVLFVGSLLWFGINIYFLCVVSSYRHEILTKQLSSRMGPGINFGFANVVQPPPANVYVKSGYPNMGYTTQNELQNSTYPAYPMSQVNYPPPPGYYVSQNYSEPAPPAAYPEQ